METHYHLHLTKNVMPIPRQLLLLAILFLSCNGDPNYRYAIKDSREPLRPYLTRIVSKGVVTYSDSSIRKMTTDKELIQLSQSEHPVLRASAFREMLHRESFNHFEVVMRHLDDTAIVLTDAGEFGIFPKTISDDILHTARWKTFEKRENTIELVLTKHNYLQSAYHILLQIEPQEKYYPYIKDMATRPRRLSEDGYELAFHDIEYALYGLAKFKKKEDVNVIKKLLIGKVRQLSDISFRLMKEFPDTAYLSILETYHRKRFYRFSGEDIGGFTGNDDNRASSKDFIEALVSQGNSKSAEIFDSILNRLTLVTCIPNKKYIEDEVIMQLWENPKPAYEKLRVKIRDKAEVILKHQVSIPVESYNLTVDSTSESIRW